VSTSLAVNHPAWMFRKISDVTTKVGSGSTPRGGESVYQSSGVPLIRSMNVHSSGFSSNGLAFIDEVEAKKLDHVIVEPNDVLLNITGASIGRVTTAPKSVAGARVNQHVCIIRPTKELVSTFLAYYLASPKQQLRVMNVQVGATRQALTKAMILNWDVPVPAIEKQQTIVTEIEKQFSRLDEAVASLKRTKVNLKRYKAAVLKAAVEGKYGSSDAANWTRTNLGEALTAIEAGKSFKCEERTPSDREIGVLKVSAVTWGTYNEKESKTCLDPDRIETRYFVRPGDFLFSRANTIELIGACVIAQKVTRKIMLSDKILRFRFSNEVLPQWILYWLRSDVGRKEIQRLSTGNQESMRNIGQDRIRQIAFAIPCIDEQHQIVAEVERRLSVIDDLETTVEANLTRVDLLRQSTLQKAFSGKLLLNEECA